MAETFDASNLTARERRLSLGAVYACMFAVGVGMGLSLPLLSLILERNGVSATLNGANTTVGALAMIVVSPFIPAIAARLGTARFLIACYIVAAAALVSFRATNDLVAWFILRFVLNSALQGLFIVSEVWINQIAAESNRGRLVAIYTSIFSAGFALGPLIIQGLGTTGWAPFIAGGAAMLVGRPNVGKSTLINRLLGEERLITFDEPGTTRDAVHVPFERDGQHYVLIDTAGVRRRSRIDERLEKWSVIKTLQAIDRAHVVVGVLDARETVSEQDATLLGIVADRGRALVIAVNKWDHVSPQQRDEIRAQLDLRLRFLDFAPLHFISALHGSGVGELMGSVRAAHAAAMREMPTPELTRVLEAAMKQHQPPLVRGRRIRLRYAHQGGRNPPIIVIHGAQAERTPEDYRRYLMNCFRQSFKLFGTPVRVDFRSEDNPFAGRRNKLTPRQRRTRDTKARRTKR